MSIIKNSNENGITLISLVITIVILMILASVLIMSFDEQEIIEASDQSVNMYKTDRETVANTVDDMTTRIDNSGMITTDKMNAIKEKIRTSTKSQLEISYTPEEVKDENRQPLEIVVPGNYNGGITDQNFTQENLGARGNNKIKWYIFSADEKGLNIVSEETLLNVRFWDSSGYDNCLYYLDQLSKKLFLNIDDFGVTENRVHAFKLSDLQKATEWYNGSNYNWKSRFEDGAPVKGEYYGLSVQSNNKYWPGVFSKYLSNGNMTILDGPESERIGSLITDDTGIERQTYGNPANTLTATGRYYAYNNSGDSTNSRNMLLNHLCITDNAEEGYGRTDIIKNEIFDLSGQDYWLASRCFKGGNIHTDFYLRKISSGILQGNELCYSNGNSSGDTTIKEGRFRVFVSIPPEHVDIDRDGNITLQ